MRSFDSRPRSVMQPAFKHAGPTASAGRRGTLDLRAVERQLTTRPQALTGGSQLTLSAARTLEDPHRAACGPHVNGMPVDSQRPTVPVPVGAQDDPLATPATATQAASPSMLSAPDQAQELAGSPKVAEVKLIKDKTGAFPDFPVAKGIDLNTPGPFNNTTNTGSCVNVHQMQFRLSQGDPGEVKLIRRVVRVASAGGKQDLKGEKDKPAPDGPSEGSVIRPQGRASVVVADAPGFIGKGDTATIARAFPVSYDGDFELFAVDAVQPRILAKMTYSVHIAKSTIADTAPKNEISEPAIKLF